jgi:hypothetical protein
MTLGRSLAAAIAAKDHEAERLLLHPEVDFRAMTPRKTWEGDLVDALQVWFGDGDQVEGVDHVETDSFADRERVGYRLRVRNGDGLHLVDQQAYLSETDGRISWLRIMCAGYRPVEG